MKNNKKIVFGVLLILAIAMSAVPLMSVSAKNFNIPDGANIIYYSGGEGYVTFPAQSLSPSQVNPITLQITVTGTIDGTNGAGTSIGISIPWTGGFYIPDAYFANVDNDAITFIKALLAGFPASIIPGNIKQVSSDDISVERHGNSITATLKTQQTIRIVTGPGQSFAATIQPFTIELNKVGGDTQRHTTTALPSGWTQEVNKIGFNAEGTITFLNQQPMTMTDCFIVMHGSTLWTPKAT